MSHEHITAVDLELQAEQLAAQLHAEGFLVTLALEAESAAIAHLLGVQLKTLQNWKCEGVAPPWRRHRHWVLYPLVEFLRWRDERPCPAGTCFLGEIDARVETALRGR